jgi:hypothetical protein
VPRSGYIKVFNLLLVARVGECVIWGLSVTAALFLLTACRNIEPVSNLSANDSHSTPATVSTMLASDLLETVQLTDIPTANATATQTETPIPLKTDVFGTQSATPVSESSPKPQTIQPVQPVASTMPAPTKPPTETPEPVLVNDLPKDSFIIMPESVRQNVLEIYEIGQLLGRNPHAFSKLGDSVTLTDHYLTRFDSGHYNLGPYAFLQSTIDHYSGSFGRYGVATRVGLHAWSIFDPLWANKEWCLPDEHMVACEIRLFNPSVMLIKVGSNDNGAASAFDENMRQLTEYLIDNGIIPVLATKADRFEGPDDRNNKMIRQIADDYDIPLWDYDIISVTLPRRGLSGDDVHMTMADSDDYTDPVSFERGYPVSDLTALMMLHSILREVNVTSGS